MEVPKNHSLKKRKKKKQKQPEESKKTIVKPELFDGMTNWLNLQKVLGALEKDRVPENSSGHSSFSKKKHLGKKHLSKNKPSSSKSQHKASYKFDFSERRSSILAAQRRATTSSTDNPESKLSDNEMSDLGTERKISKPITDILAMDCEMVGTGPDGADSILARVSIVNCFGDCIYDTFVAPKEKVTDYRTEFSGVRPSNLKNAKDLFDVQKEVLEIIDGKKIVGHDLKHDFDALFISHPNTLVRDTSKYKPFRVLSGGRTPSLKKLVAVILACDIQDGEHNSIEDAQAAMLLYLKHKREWEKSIRSLQKRRKAH